MVSAKHRPWARELSLYWQRRGRIEYCELRFPVCVGTHGLAPAHSKDRDEIYTKADFWEVVAACSECHFYADRKMPKEERLKLFKQVIANRDYQVSA